MTKDLDKIFKDIDGLNLQHKMKLAFSILSSVMIERREMKMKSGINLGKGVSMTVISVIKTHNDN